MDSRARSTLHNGPVNASTNKDNIEKHTANSLVKVKTNKHYILTSLLFPDFFFGDTTRTAPVYIYKEGGYQISDISMGVI